MISNNIPLNKPNISSYIAGGKRRLYYSFGENLEMIEEYDMKTHDIQMRRWKRKGELGEKEEFEIGEPASATGQNPDAMIMASSSNPVFVRRDNLTEFQFRIRNLTYPQNVYTVTIDEEKDQIVVRTSNKKYFKRFEIPDLKRSNTKLIDKNQSWCHANNTLVVTYEKPQEVLKREKLMRDKFIAFNAKNPKEGDFEGSV